MSDCGTLQCSIATVFPELYDSFLKTSLVGRAQEQGKVHFTTSALSSFSDPGERIDAPVLGHGPGMLIKPSVVERAVAAYEQQHGPAYKIFFSPQGEQLTQDVLVRIAQRSQAQGHVMLLPARYEGMDARVEDQYADEIISVGDFVLMGGDVPAMMLIEGMLRLIPGVVGRQESVERDSYSGPFFDYPAYTKPVTWQGATVPDVVRSGHHAELEKWRTDTAARNSVNRNFSWVRSQEMNVQNREYARAHIPPHYVALLHGDVVVGPERTPGVTSVTSVDIHDIARSSCTYGAKGFFIVTPLEDQQEIVKTLIDYWQVMPHGHHRANRQEAMDLVRLLPSFNEVFKAITEREGCEPVVVATSAQRPDGVPIITYHDQQRVWDHDAPVLLLFGTGSGISPDLIARADYTLLPVQGFADFNHLSVRSAAAIVLDRWLGINQKRIG